MCESIDQVLNRLDEIIHESEIKKSVLGYFPALYRQVTQSVKDHIEAGYFDDNARMEQLDVIFANRYLKAYQQYTKKENCTASWRLAFEGERNIKLIVLQHLFLCMNAHINLDLGIAAATVCPGSSIQDLKNDFFKINIVLSKLVNEVQNQLADIWPLMWVIDWLSGNLDEALSDFSMNIARDGAWRVAQDLANMNPDQQQVYIGDLDKRVHRFGSGISQPGFLMRRIVSLVRIFESKDVSKNIQILNKQSLLIRQNLSD